MSYTCDMTKGSEVKLLLKFTLPMLIGNIFQQFYNMADSIIVGNAEGKNSFAAIGATGSINFLFFSLCSGLSVGIGILISQYFGAQNEDKVKKAIANSIYIIAVSGIIMSVLSVILARPVLILLDTPKVILDEAVIYMQIVCGGLITVAAYNAIASILRALGDSKTPLVFLVVACIINIVLDLVFVLGLNLGVAGAAIATVIAQATSAIGCILYAVRKFPYFKLEREHRKVDKIIIEQCVRIGFPVAAQSTLISISCIFLQRVVNGFGEDVVAAFTASNRIEQLVQQPYNSLGAAVATFTGQNIGAGHVDRVKKGYHKSILMVAIFSFVMLLLARFLGAQFVWLFVKEEKVIELGAKALQITSLFYFPLGMIYITRSLLNGAGDAFASMVNGIAEVIGRVLFPTVLISIPFIGVWGIWYTTGLTWFITGLAGFLRYKQGKWKYRSLVR